MSMSENRIAAIPFVWSRNILATGNRHSMMVCRTALSGEQVIIAVHFINMRRLCPDRSFDRSIPQHKFLANELHAPDVNFTKINFGVTYVKSFFIQTICHEPDTSIIIKKKGWIESVRIFKPIRFAPWTLRLGRCHDEVSRSSFSIHQGVNHVECSVMMANRRSI